MDKSRIEDMVKRKLQGHQEDIDKNELWESLGIESEGKKRRGAWWMWSGVLLVFLLVAYIGTQVLTTHSKEVSNSTITTTATNAKNSIANMDTSETHEQSATTTIIPKVDLRGGDTEQAAYKPTAITSSVKQKADIAVSNLPTPEEANAMSRQTLTKEERYSLVGMSKEIIGLQPKTNSAEVKEGEATNIVAVESKNTQQRIDSRLTLLELQQRGVVGKDRTIDVDKVTVPALSSPTQNAARAWAAYAEYGAVSRSLTSVRGAEEEAAIRNDSESVTDYLAVGLQYRHRVSKNLRIYTGLRYAQINESMIYTQRDSQTVAADAVTRFTDINGVTTTSTTEGEGLEILEKKWTYQNQMKIVSIPIGLLYEQRFGRWGFDVEAGLALKLASRFSGEVLTMDSEIVANPQYLNTGLGYEWSVGFFGKYQFTENSYLSFGPSYRQYANSFATGANGMQQTYSTVGGRLSFVTRF